MFWWVCKNLKFITTTNKHHSKKKESLNAIDQKKSLACSFANARVMKSFRYGSVWASKIALVKKEKKYKIGGQRRRRSKNKIECHYIQNKILPPITISGFEREIVIHKRHTPQESSSHAQTVRRVSFILSDVKYDSMKQLWDQSSVTSPKWNIILLMKHIQPTRHSCACLYSTNRMIAISALRGWWGGHCFNFANKKIKPESYKSCDLLWLI